MTDHKFTDDDVIKALECCDENDCYPCCYRIGGVDCRDRMQRDALALINSQKIEIESLKIANEKMYSANKEQEAEIEAWKEEVNRLSFWNHIKRTAVIDEFAERLRKRARMPLGTLYGTMVYLKDIDTLVKEMTEK